MKRSLEEAIANSKSPNVVDYFSQGFNIVFKKFWLFVLMSLLMAAIAWAASKVIGLDFVNSLLVQPLLIMGLFIVADKINYQEEVVFENFFDGFKKQVVPVLLSNFLRGLAVLPALAIMGYAYVQMLGWDNLVAAVEGNTDAVDPSMIDFSGTNILILLLGVVIALIVALLFIFTLPMIRFKGLDAIKAMSASAKLVGKHFFSFLLFAILAVLINLAGALLLLVGLLVTVPATYCALYVAFDDLVEARESESSDEDVIIDHFIS